MLEHRLANDGCVDYALTAEVIAEVDASSFARWGIAGKDALNIPCNASLKAVMDENNLDTAAGVYFCRRDALYDLPDFLPKHDRQ